MVKSALFIVASALLICGCGRDVNKTNDKFKKLEAENKNLESENESLKTKNRQIEVLEKKLQQSKELESTINSLENKLNSTTSELIDKNIQLEETQKQLTAKEESLKELASVKSEISQPQTQSGLSSPSDIINLNLAKHLQGSWATECISGEQPDDYPYRTIFTFKNETLTWYQKYFKSKVGNVCKDRFIDGPIHLGSFSIDVAPGSVEYEDDLPKSFILSFSDNTGLTAQMDHQIVGTFLSKNTIQFTQSNEFAGHPFKKLVANYQAEKVP